MPGAVESNEQNKLAALYAAEMNKRSPEVNQATWEALFAEMLQGGIPLEQITAFIDNYQAETAPTKR